MKPIYQARYVMGTVVEIAAIDWAESADAALAIRQALERFELLERQFSRFDPDSELSQVNRQGAAGPVHVSAEFFEVVSRGLKYAERSGGVFSISLAPLMDLWAGCAAEERFPARCEVEKSRQRSVSTRIRLDSTRRTVQFVTPGVALDFGGLVKGYAVDEATKVLRNGGVSRGVVNAGSSSISMFGPPRGAPHRIGLRRPVREPSLVGILALASGCLSTSGTYERQWHFRNSSLSQLIDPRTGTPLGRMSSATVICDSAELGEVVSKVLLFHGCQPGIELCDANGWAAEGAVLEVSPPEGDCRMDRTLGFPWVQGEAGEPLFPRLSSDLYDCEASYDSNSLMQK